MDTVMETINGITLERYAELVSKTTDTITTEEFWQAIENEGVSREDWIAAKDGWNAVIFDPNNYLTLMQDYNEYFEKCIEIKNNGNAPCTLEKFADINAQLYYRKDPNDTEKNMDYEAIMKDNGIAPLKWTEYSGYWAPKTAREEYMQKYYDLLNEYSRKYT
jgi:hypothetical protein